MTDQNKVICLKMCVLLLPAADNSQCLILSRRVKEKLTARQKRALYVCIISNEMVLFVFSVFVSNTHSRNQNSQSKFSICKLPRFVKMADL